MVRRMVVSVVAATGAALSLSGCLLETSSGILRPASPNALSGSVTGFPITGTYDAILTGATTSACNQVTISATLTDAAGNRLFKRESGTLCLLGLNAFFSGSYVITGGEGLYAGATGSGSSQMDFRWSSDRGGIYFAFTGLEVGTFNPGGTATAAARKRFRARGTVRSGRGGSFRLGKDAAARLISR